MKITDIPRQTAGDTAPAAYSPIRLDASKCGTATPRISFPKMVGEVASIDFFFHDPERKLNRGGLVVGDDVSWNASLGDFADDSASPPMISRAQRKWHFSKVG